MAHVPRRLMLTVDVEAQPPRAASDWVERLIWGRFPDGSFGLGEMMAVAEKHGAPMTMFLDYAEEPAYGEALLDVGREIVRRGHDLELHLHQTLLPDAFYEERGVAPVRDLSLVQRGAARHLATYLRDAQMRAAGVPPVAFRGGGYRYNDALLEELQRAGVRLNSSYNPAHAKQRMNMGPTRQFRWTNGVYEVPVSTVNDFRGATKIVDYDFNRAVFLKCPVDECVRRHMQFLDEFHSRHGEDAIAVLVFHSWSFLGMDELGHRTVPIYDAAERLDGLLAALEKTTEVVDTHAVLDLLDRGEIAFEDDVAFRFDELEPAR